MKNRWLAVTLTAALLLAWVPLTAGAASEEAAISEAEPNGTPQTATVIPMRLPFDGEYRPMVSGALPAGDTDWYTFTLNESRGLTLSWTAAVTVTLCYGDQAAVLREYPPEDGAGAYRRIGLRAGVYCLKVTAPAAVEGYELSMAFRCGVPGDTGKDFEPNDARETAGSVWMAKMHVSIDRHSGVLDVPGDVDYYAFTADGLPLRVQLDSSWGGGGDFQAAIERPDGGVAAQGVLTGAYPFLGATLPAGEYFLRLSRPEGGGVYPADYSFYLLRQGDVNRDGSIDSADARLALQYEVGLAGMYRSYDFAAADVSGDGEVDSTDARLILQYEVGLITAF